MVNMAEAEPAAMFLTTSQHRLQSLDVDMTSDADSEPDEAPSLLMMRSFHHPSSGELKRNKRKNFQPRNISYTEDPEIYRRNDRESSGDSGDEGGALDLSNADVVPSGNKRFRKTLLNVPPTKRFEGSTSERSNDHESNAPVPMDLSCGKNAASDYPDESVHSETESNSEDSERTETSGKREFQRFDSGPASEQPSPHQYLLHHAFLSQPQDASDLKEYAQNTVKELLEIYGLNSAEVAESITNNVPISNFNSGKILESLSARAMGLRPGGPAGPTSPGSQPPTPPRTPLSPHKTNSSPGPRPQGPLGSKPSAGAVESMAAKFAGLASNNNSRMSLPQNMATILALAAMQDRQGPKTPASGASTPSTSNNESPASLTGTPRMPLSPGSVRDPAKASAPVDYSRYVRRFSSALECNSSYCKDLNYREHFHCLDCNSRVFVKKEEMIRHFKWHKKRDESLQHGFMRYSPSDDCSDRYHNCTHNRKQTHYHCIQGTCDKVYISTSDVQMHANYHRKDSAIIQEGFQRLRATEECRTPYCAFFGQRTTHFHCRREHCQFTFKNKADMEKHKTYHIKDEQLARDGFKKFLKPDICGFPNCRFSQVCNHIHCVRDGCSYVLHSSGQLLSHKRKHERKDSEIAYRKFKLAQQAVVNLANSEHIDNEPEYENDGRVRTLISGKTFFCSFLSLKALLNTDVLIHSNSKMLKQEFSKFNRNLAQHGDSPSSSLQLLQQASSLAALTALHDSNFSNSSSEGRASPTRVPRTPQPQGSLQLMTPPSYRGDSPASALDLSSEEGSDSWAHYPTGVLCPAGPKCGLFQTDHYHCKEPNCDMPFRCRESAEGHAKIHEAQDRVSDNFYQDNPATCHDNCPRERHFHCTWDGCNDAVLPNERFEHFRNHELTASQNNSLDALFRRKRGRPPKNRVIEVWNDYAGGMGSDSPQAIFTSFKLPKPAGVPPALAVLPTTAAPDALDPRTPSPAEPPPRPSLQMLEMHGFQAYNDGCPDPLCLYSAKPLHYHCSRQRCFFATDSEEQLLAHSKDFHDNIEILDGFLFFDRSVDCRLESCVSNKVNRHFHCVRPGCGYSFVRYSSMSLHQAKHLAENSGGMSCGGDTTLDLSSNDNREPQQQFHQQSPHQHQPQQQQHHQPAECERSPIKEASQALTPTGLTAANPGLLPSIQQSPENGSAARTTVVKASGTFYPLCGLTNARSSSPSTEMTVKTEPPSEPHTLPEWMNVDRHERYGPELSCSRPFCKLKRKEHYHCNACNQAFSELERLRPHIAKHSPSAIPPIMVKQEHNNNEEAEEHPHPAMGMMPMNLDSGELLPPPPPPHYPGFGAAMAAAVAANQQLAMMTSQGIPFLPHGMPALYTSPSGLMFTAHPGFSPHHAALMGNGLLESARASMGLAVGDHSATDSLLARSLPSPHRDMSPETKKVRVQTSMRILKDEPVPEGYVRFRFNEDCRYNHCGYREHQTHFHCMRKDCGYSFCDKTRFVQHTARHERLDTLMGGDFQQYRANVSCGRPECVYTATLGTVQNKASHFHCLKCDFVCTDTNKVVAHRRHHQKLDSIMAAGFEKFTPTQPCSASDTCIHSKKQTHYHCLSCQYAVLGLSQMTAHKYRHLE